MKLICEDNFNDVHCIKESTESGTTEYYIEGVCMTHTLENKNKRHYSKSAMLEEVDSYNENYINKNRALGELSHPTSPTVNLERVSHKYVTLYPDGPYNICGKAKIITKNPFGQIAANLIEEDIQLGVSSRSLGKIEKNTGLVPVFRLKAIDIVHEPSAHNAFVRGIMEGREWFPDDTPWQVSERLTEAIKNKVNKASSRKLQQVQLECWKKFLDVVSKNTKI